MPNLGAFPGRKGEEDGDERGGGGGGGGVGGGGGGPGGKGTPLEGAEDCTFLNSDLSSSSEKETPNEICNLDEKNSLLAFSIFFRTSFKCS